MPLRFLRVLVASALLSSAILASAQSDSDPYTVNKSGGDSTSPAQPPPGSYLWNQEQRLSQLAGLKQEIAQYVAAKYWSDVQAGTHSKWTELYDTISGLAEGAAGATESQIRELGTQKDRIAISEGRLSAIKPDEPIQTKPKDLEGQEPAIDENHLEILRHAIRYDATKLGLPIDPNSGTVEEILSRLSSRIDGEIKTTRDVLGKAHVAIPSNIPDSPGPASGTFDPSKMTPQERAAWQRNQAIVAGETLKPATSDNSKEPGNPNPPPSTSTTFDPSKMTPSEKTAWQKNQAIVAGETLHPRVPPTVPPSSADTTVGFDPSTLSPSERAAWERNQANMAKETLAKTGQTGDPLAEALNQNMKGEMGADNPYTKDQMIPPSAADNSKDRSNPKPTPSTGVTFDPSRMTPQEKAAWQQNQAIVAGETLHPTVPPAVSPASADTTLGFDPSTLSPSERAAWERNQANMAKETLGQTGQASSPTSASPDIGNLASLGPGPSIAQNSTQQWADAKFPELNGPSTMGSMTLVQPDKYSLDGLMAHNDVKGNLLNSTGGGYFSSTWTVKNGDQVIGSGFSDVQFEGGGRFLAKLKYNGNDGYKIYDASTGKPISTKQFSYVTPLGDGYFGVPTATAGIGMTDIVDPNGNVVVKGAYPSNALIQYTGNGHVAYMINGNTLGVQIPSFQPPRVPTQAVAPSPSPNSVVLVRSAPAPGGILLDPTKQKQQAVTGLDKEIEQMEKDSEDIPKKN